MNNKKQKNNFIAFIPLMIAGTALSALSASETTPVTSKLKLEVVRTLPDPGNGETTVRLIDVSTINDTVYVPAKDAAAVTESGKTIGKSAGLKLLRVEDGAVVIEVGSGQYHFESSQL